MTSPNSDIRDIHPELLVSIDLSYAEFTVVIDEIFGAPSALLYPKYCSNFLPNVAAPMLFTNYWKVRCWGRMRMDNPSFYTCTKWPVASTAPRER